MLNTKFHGDRLTDSGKDDFEGFLKVILKRYSKGKHKQWLCHQRFVRFMHCTGWVFFARH